MIQINCGYRVQDDIKFLLEAEKINSLELSEQTLISRTTIEEMLKKGKARADVLEKLYSYAYKQNYRFNTVKEELLKEENPQVLFHGSKFGLNNVSIQKSRENCDFGKGFYLGESYSQALSFVNEYEKSSVYSFRYKTDKLKIKEFICDMDWMLAICYYRGNLKNYRVNKTVSKIVKDVESADIIIAPIADNKMFYIMNQFTEGEINASVALHSLSASQLGLQYVFKTDKSLENLEVVEKYYISTPERNACSKQQEQRSFEIDTKFKLAKRNYRDGLFIEELLK